MKSGQSLDQGSRGRLIGILKPMHNGTDLHLHEGPGRNAGLDCRVQLALLKMVSEPELERPRREAKARRPAPGM